MLVFNKKKYLFAALKYLVPGTRGKNANVTFTVSIYICNCRLLPDAFPFKFLSFVYSNYTRPEQYKEPLLDFLQFPIYLNKTTRNKN